MATWTRVFEIVIIATKVVFSSTFITIGLKKSFISQPEEDVYRVSDMLINMLSWNVSITHDTKLQRDLDFKPWYKSYKTINIRRLIWIVLAAAERMALGG